MSFPINSEEQQFDSKVKEVSQITYTVDKDTGLIRNLVRVVMTPPLEVADTTRFIDEYGSVVVKVDAIDDDCGLWLDDNDRARCSPANGTVLFVYLTPAQPGAQAAEVQEVIRKLKSLIRTT